MASIGRIDHSKISLKNLSEKHIKHITRTFEDWLKESATGTNRLTIWCPERDMGIMDLATEAKPYNYDIVYIDYIGLLKMDAKKALWEMLGVHARNAKMAANASNSVWVLLAQRDEEENKIKYSQAIKAFAHVVWSWERTDKDKEAGIVQISMMKNRGGKVHDFTLEAQMDIMSFRDYKGLPPVQQTTETTTEVPRMPELPAG